MFFKCIIVWKRRISFSNEKEENRIAVLPVVISRNRTKHICLVPIWTSSGTNPTAVPLHYAWSVQKHWTFCTNIQLCNIGLEVSVYITVTIPHTFRRHYMVMLKYVESFILVSRNGISLRLWLWHHKNPIEIWDGAYMRCFSSLLYVRNCRVFYIMCSFTL